MKLFAPTEMLNQRIFWLVQKKDKPTKMSNQRRLELELYRRDVEPT